MPYKISLIVGATIASIVFLVSVGYKAGCNSVERKYAQQLAKANELIQQKDTSSAKIATQVYFDEIATNKNYNQLEKGIQDANTINNVYVDDKWMRYYNDCATKTRSSK